MNIKHPFIAEILTVIALVAAPFVLPHLGFSLTTVDRILIWGLFGLGFDLLFGYIGLLSFGQSAFFGTGGMFAAYLLTEADFPYVLTSIVIGAGVAGLADRGLDRIDRRHDRVDRGRRRIENGLALGKSGIRGGHDAAVRTQLLADRPIGCVLGGVRNRQAARNLVLGDG